MASSKQTDEIVDVDLARAAKTVNALHEQCEAARKSTIAIEIGHHLMTASNR
ncbi:MAG: hypothetical protein WCG50_13250 [Rhodoferax sp.]